jgi:multidrug efflux system membrane fusion protein
MTTPSENHETGPAVQLPGLNGPESGPGKSRKSGLLWAVFLLIIASVAVYAVWRAGHPQPAAQQKGAGGGGGGRGGGGRSGGGPVPVVVTKVERSSIPEYLLGLGSVSPYYTVTVKSRVDGQLMKVDFNEGDLVKEGQVLCEIDPRPFQVQLDMAQATQAHDQALLANARVDLNRYQLLVKTDAIPQQQLDTQTALVAQYEAQIKQDQANIDAAKLNLVYSKVPAPITGVLGLRLVDPGNIVHASDNNGMITITQLQPIAVLFTIPEDNLPEVTQKLRTGVHLPADAYNRDMSKKLASGTLVTLDNQIDPSTGTSKLKAVFENKEYTLFPQQFVNIKLLVDTLTNQLVVPNVAVQNGQQGTFVYVVDDQSRVHLKTVQEGIQTETSTQILSGISDGDRVVIDGTDRLVENAVVRVRKPGEMENTPDSGAGGRGGRGGKGQNKGGQGQGRGQGQGAATANEAAPAGAGGESGGPPPNGTNPGGFKKGAADLHRGGEGVGDFKKGGGSKKSRGGGGPQ